MLPRLFSLSDCSLSRRVIHPHDRLVFMLHINHHRPTRRLRVILARVRCFLFPCIEAARRQCAHCNRLHIIRGKVRQVADCTKPRIGWAFAAFHSTYVHVPIVAKRVTSVFAGIAEIAAAENSGSSVKLLETFVHTFA